MSLEPHQERDLEHVMENIRTSNEPFEERERRSRIVQLARVVFGMGQDERKWPEVVRDYRPLHKRYE